MAGKIQAIRGMHDILPEQVHIWQTLESTMQDLFGSYGYQEIRMPLLEKTDLFKRSIGEVTDIVEKEMYTFEDRNGDSLTLRPEGTAGCVRACIENGLLHNQVHRLWYSGPMFRHERPQKGRYRQFYQAGVECFGMQGPDIDAEHIVMTARLWERLGIRDVRLEINSLGSSKSRAEYQDVLVDYYRAHINELDDDSVRRLESNPMRILDSKNPDMKQLIASAPVMIDHLDEESKQHFERLLGYLDDVGIRYDISPKLVRGLDYYGKTVFEWITDSLGAQGTICAGGRFDGLVEQLGGRKTPAMGFAIGIERMVALLEETGVAPGKNSPHAYLVMVGDEAQSAGFKLVDSLRTSVPGLKIVMHCGGGSYKSQFKKADKSGASLALIIGDDEIANGVISIKPLRSDDDQQQLSHDDVEKYLQEFILN
ncbi:MAG: histidine--tRNA ligase [Gammaproteobacteria bacterium]|nr:MAG: histidine--tRNA ligase [Gammaproteobacteria bacterium]